MRTTENIWSVPALRPTALVLAFVTVLCAGVAFPYLIHMIGGPSLGKILLPMPFIVLLAGALFGWEIGLLSGLAIPVFSWLISGMPVLPVLSRFMLELAVSGFLIGVFVKKLKFGAFLSPFLALVLCRVCLALPALTGHTEQLLFLQGLKQGLPGLLLQTAILPFAIIVAKRFILKHDSRK
jgi:hypothetical protein